MIRRKTSTTVRNKLTIDEKPLTILQQSYVSLFNGSIKETAALANISYNYARQLHTQPHIKKAIQARQQTEFRKDIVNRQELQAFWSNVMQDSTIIMSDRLRASEFLAKSNAMFTENLKVHDTALHRALDERKRLIGQRLADVYATLEEGESAPALPAAKEIVP